MLITTTSKGIRIKAYDDLDEVICAANDCEIADVRGHPHLAHRGESGHFHVESKLADTNYEPRVWVSELSIFVFTESRKLYQVSGPSYETDELFVAWLRKETELTLDSIVSLLLL